MKKRVLNHSNDPAGCYTRMRLLINTGLLLLLINSALGRAFHEDKREEISISTDDEEPTESSCNCNWRYHKHYETKGCKAEQLDSCGCPRKYICPVAGDTSENQKTCIYQNEEYQIGSRINVTDNCQFCRCLGGVQPQITCRHKECPQLEAGEGENCHLVYEKNHCCPSKYECVLNTNENVASEKGSFCEHAGITYPYGAKIYPSDDPCLRCECNENWEELGRSNCYRQDCLLERKMMLLNKGCIPIYHEKKCCPIEFYCPENLYLNSIPLENDESDLIEENLEIQDIQDDTCIFGGQSYEIGMELSMKNPCVKCSCLVPPDLTCVHQSCPLPPKVEDCEVVHLTNSCCPSYTCLQDNTSKSDGNIECPTPICADETCEITTPEGHLCPTCICNESISHEKNMLEPENQKEEPSVEEMLKNSSLAEIEKLENENFDAEILIPIETDEFSSENTNMSEKFIDDSDKKEHMEYDEIDVAEQEMDESANFFEKDRESFEDSSKEDLGDDLDLINGSESSDDDSKIYEEAILSKIIKKRSTEHRNTNQYLNQAQQYGQQQFFEEEEDENDREILENDNEGFDELKLSSRSKKNEDNKNTEIDDLITDSSETFIVPDGCPTPICENFTCKIVIPVGHLCPTCLCKSRGDWQP